MVSLLGDCLGEDFGGIVVEWGWWKCCGKRKRRRKRRRKGKYDSTNVGRHEICVFGHVFLFGNVDDCEELFSLCFSSSSPSSSPFPSSLPSFPQDVSIYLHIQTSPPPSKKEEKKKIHKLTPVTIQKISPRKKRPMPLE